MIVHWGRAKILGLPSFCFAFDCLFQWTWDLGIVSSSCFVLEANKLQIVRVCKGRSAVFVRTKFKIRDKSRHKLPNLPYFAKHSHSKPKKNAQFCLGYFECCFKQLLVGAAHQTRAKHRALSMVMCMGWWQWQRRSCALKAPCSFSFSSYFLAHLVYLDWF
jgi:hypothetical protein